MSNCFGTLQLKVEEMKMFEDKYLINCKRLYALKAGELIKKDFSREYFEYTHCQMTQGDIVKLLGLLSVELYKCVGKSKVGDRVDDDWVLNKISSLDEDKYEPTLWARELDKIFTKLPGLFETFKKIQNKILENRLKKEIKNSPFEAKLSEFAKIFKLSKKEREIVTFLYLAETCDEVSDFLSAEPLNLNKPAKCLKTFCKFFDANPQQVKEILAKDALLVRAGIVKKRRDEIDLSVSVLGYLNGLNMHSLEEDYVKKADLKETLFLQDHHVAQEKVLALKNLLSTTAGTNILLYGHPGTGKTEFAKSLAKETGRDVFFIRQSDLSGDEDLSFRKQAIIAANNIIQSKKAVIVVDECDKILNIVEGNWRSDDEAMSDGKAWINDFLETTKHKIIWISNKINAIDDSTKRRFSYSLEFSPLSFTQRKKVWEIQVQKQGIDFLKEEDLTELARNVKVNSGGITLALKDVAGMKTLKTIPEKIKVLKTILTQHQSFTTDTTVGILKKSSKYSLELVNCDFPLDKLLTHAGNFLSNTSDFHQKGVFNLNLLLQGPPGTGKTEFVKHMGDALDKEIIVKRASDIRSMWYGESVRNIARCFREAQDSGNILFFDEADSFFGARETETSHHAEETNELLTQMENFKGILICATNFTQKLDQASMRRFNFKVKFDYLNQAAKKNMFLSYFSEHFSSEPDEATWRRLESIPGLTPGDFKVAYQKNVFNEKRSPNAFLDELSTEVSYKKAVSKKVGLT